MHGQYHNFEMGKSYVLDCKLHVICMVYILCVYCVFPLSCWNDSRSFNKKTRCCHTGCAFMELATLSLLERMQRNMSFLISSMIHTEELSSTRKTRSQEVRASVWNTAWGKMAGYGLMQHIGVHNIYQHL